MRYFSMHGPPGHSDWKKYPYREICPSDSVFNFKKNENPEYIKSLFEPKQASLGLESFEDYIEKTETNALIIIRNDTILFEDYFNGFARDDLFMAMSMTKSFVYTLLGIAVDEGLIENTDEPVTKYLPELIGCDTRFERITIKHLMMMCSGIEQRKATLGKVPLPWDGDPVSYAYPQLRKYILENLKILNEPAQHFYYNDFNAELIGLVLERVIDRTVSEYCEDKLWKPCGMEYPAYWTMDSKKSAFEKKSSGLFARPVDFARYGRLYLENGCYEGIHIVTEDWIAESTQREYSIDTLVGYYPPSPSEWLDNTYYKYHWKGHVNNDSTVCYSISGQDGQSVLISPRKNLIIVHSGSGSKYFGVENLCMIELLMDNPFYGILLSVGLGEAINYIDSLTSKQQELPITESLLNMLGYNYLNNGNVEKAIDVFELNVRVFPMSSNVYDSLGEAYMKNSQYNLAVENYRKSLELKPDNENAKLMINKLTRSNR